MTPSAPGLMIARATTASASLLPVPPLWACLGPALISTPRRRPTWPLLRGGARPGATTAVAMSISSHLPAEHSALARVQSRPGPAPRHRRRCCDVKDRSKGNALVLAARPLDLKVRLATTFVAPTLNSMGGNEERPT